MKHLAFLLAGALAFSAPSLAVAQDVLEESETMSTSDTPGEVADTLEPSAAPEKKEKPSPGKRRVATVHACSFYTDAPLNEAISAMKPAKDIEAELAKCDKAGSRAFRLQALKSNAVLTPTNDVSFVVWFRGENDELISPDEAGFEFAYFLVGGERVDTDITVSRQNGVVSVTTQELDAIGRHGQAASLVVVFDQAGTKDAIQYQRQELFFRFKSRVELYRAFDGALAIGLWFPNPGYLFSTNFNRGSEGLAISGALVSAAWGAKFATKFESFRYVGASVFAGATFASVQDMATDEREFNAQLLSFGLLADLAGYAYVGPSWVLDTRSGMENPGFTLTLGLGPKLLAFLGGAPSTQ